LTLALYASLFLVSTCGLIYELVAGALASYLLGDTVLQFSTVIGAYLFAMGLGSWASRHVGRGLVARFVQVELMVGVIGGFRWAIGGNNHVPMDWSSVLISILVVTIITVSGLRYFRATEETFADII